MAVGSVNEQRTVRTAAAAETAAAPSTAATLATATASADAFVAPEQAGGPVLNPEPPPSRTRESAVAEAGALLLGPASETDSPNNGATIVSDAPDVNDPADTTASARNTQARAQVEANQPLEDEALAGMTEAERAQYTAVKTAAAADPVAQLALQKMLLEGKLPGAPDLTGQGTTLDHLATLADPATPLAEGIDRGALVADLVQELATPTSINQRQKNTCTATTVGIQLAMEHPAEYARLIAGLASPEGQVTLASGNTLSRVADTAQDDGSGRTVTQRLLAPAFMDYANGSLATYDNAEDRNELGPIPLWPGAPALDVDNLLQGLYGRTFEHRTLLTGGVMEKIDRQVADGKTVPVTLHFGDELLSWHKVLVTGTSTEDGVDYVHYVNPWGREEKMPREEFESRLREANWDPAPRVPAAAPLVASAALQRQRGQLIAA